MKKIVMVMVFVIFLTAVSTIIYAAEKAHQEVIDFAHSELVNLGTETIIVEAVKAENAQGKTLDQIKEMDEKWKASPGITDFMKELMDSECGKYLRALQEKMPYYAKIFVMDNQGANVAMSNKTSDYWQGDEAKFIESYKDGAGGIHISDIEFDDSTQAYLVQVSVPVKDEDTVIGAITIGIDLDIMEAQ